MLSSISFPVFVSDPFLFFSFLLLACVNSTTPTLCSRIDTRTDSRQATNKGYRRIVRSSSSSERHTPIRYVRRSSSFLSFLFLSSFFLLLLAVADGITLDTGWLLLFSFLLLQHDYFFSIRTTVVRWIPLDLYVEIVAVVVVVVIIILILCWIPSDFLVFLSNEVNRRFVGSIYPIIKQ